jgi:hypothetical protein
MKLGVDRIHRLPRLWSNRELARFAAWFTGDVVNVSAWQDEDKEGRRYRDYFTAAASYTLTNYKAEMRGFQGREGEIFLDLTAPLDPGLVKRFDVVFNHTTLEHVYEVQVAFRNLCAMSRDVVILVVPFLQPYHGTYGDYWRFTPLAVRRMFEDAGMTLLYLSFNSHRAAAVYVFAIASWQPERWHGRFDWQFSVEVPGAVGDEPYVGCRALPNRLHRWLILFRRFLRSLGHSLARLLGE